LTLSGYRFHAVVRDGAARCSQGAAADADATASTTTETLQAIGHGRISLSDAIESGKIELQGSRRAFRQLFQLFELPSD
ncbi:MAG: SCP2 sterol-binding domain-containing protein, partial [Gammaproteobacteria bacterium]|nr:SCP2 sterol-binding domain-containing protein [Gammaproteobacteria bacterium]